MAKQFNKFRITLDRELVGYFNTPLDINSQEALMLLEKSIGAGASIEVVTDKPTNSKLLELIGKSSSETQSEDKEVTY